MHLRREHQTWMFRRRVPRELQARLGRREIYRSLSTSCKREAKKLASVLYAASEEVFRLASDESITDEELRAAARYWLNTPRWRERLRLNVDELPAAWLRRERHDLPRRLLSGEPEEAEACMPAATIEELEAWSALEASGYDGASKNDIKRMQDALLRAVDDYVERRFEAVFRPERTVAATAADAKPGPSPLFSQNIDAFLTDKSRSTEDHRGYSQQTRLQALATFRLWTELIGDRPVQDYTGADAREFRELLLKLPASHGKGAKVAARKAIAVAEKTGAKRLSMKTAKRHFSTLRQYWAWLKPLGYVSGDNIFSGHSFPGTKSSKRKRKDWSPEDLERLFRSRRWRTAPADSAWRWLPLIALHSGMRLEEICRLRPDLDVADKDGIPCFVIQKQTAPWPEWDPKTEAGERIVPVHPFLVRIGFLELVERRRTEGAHRLFPDLVPGGPDGKLGFVFSREFSRFKSSLGVAEKTVFHSFRHTFRTVLESTDLKESWIDAVLGHEGEGKSVGRIYVKRVAVKRLAEVVEAFESPCDLSFLIR